MAFGVNDIARHGFAPNYLVCVDHITRFNADRKPFVSTKYCEVMFIYDQVTKILVEEYEIDAGAVARDASLADLGLDSLHVVEFLFRVEEEYDIEIPEERAMIGTLGEATDLIDELIAARAAE